MKIRFGDLSITGPYSELKSLFTMLSLDDLEKFNRIEKKLDETKYDLTDLERKISHLTKIVRTLDEDVINKIVEAMK